MSLVNDGDCKVRTVPVSGVLDISAGDPVNVNSSGYAVAAGQGASLVFGGIALQDANNLTGVSGDITVPLGCYGAFQLKFDSAVTNANLDAVVYASGSGLMTLTSGSTPVPVGRLLRLPPGLTSATTASVMLHAR